MTRDELIDQYFDWMYQLVVDDRYSNKSYRKLFARLYDTGIHLYDSDGRQPGRRRHRP